MNNTDFRVVNRGTVWTFEPITAAARQFVAGELQIQAWQWLGPCFGVDHRPARHLLSILADRGFALCSLLAN